MNGKQRPRGAPSGAEGPTSRELSNGKAAATVLAILAVAAIVGVACNSEVTVDTSGTGGAAGHAGSGGAGASATGGASTGGTSVGGSSTGGTSVGGSSTGGASGGTAGGGGALTCPGFGDACTTCLSNECADTWCSCDAEPHCLGYLQCLGTCMQGDAACFQSCAAVHEAGISLGILTADCAATTCDADCNFGKALTPCQTCLYTTCSAEMNACIADAECLALAQCLGQCMPGDMACSQACLSAHPDGLSKAQAVGACRNQSCSADCP